VAGPDGPAGLREARLADLPTVAVENGLSFHDEIAAAVASNSPSPYQVHAFAGKRQPTWQSLTSNHGQRTYLQLQRGRNHQGDGTVPLFSAIPPEWGSTEDAIYQAVRHGGLCLAEAVLDLVLDKIEPLDMGDVLSPPCELGLDIPEITGAGQPLDVRVDSDRQDLLIHARLENPETGELVTEARMTPDGIGGYLASFEPEPGTWRVVAEAVAERPQVIIEDLVTVIDTSLIVS
jgi:hypothetical protein